MISTAVNRAIDLIVKSANVGLGTAAGATAGKPLNLAVKPAQPSLSAPPPTPRALQPLIGPGGYAISKPRETVESINNSRDFSTGSQMASGLSPGMAPIKGRLANRGSINGQQIPTGGYRSLGADPGARLRAIGSASQPQIQSAAQPNDGMSPQQRARANELTAVDRYRRSGAAFGRLQTLGQYGFLPEGDTFARTSRGEILPADRLPGAQQIAKPAPSPPSVMSAGIMNRDRTGAMASAVRSGVRPTDRTYQDLAAMMSGPPRGAVLENLVENPDFARAVMQYRPDLATQTAKAIDEAKRRKAYAGSLTAGMNLSGE